MCSRYTYQDLAPWPRSWPTLRGVGRDTRFLIQCPKWSRDGPDIDVKEAIRPSVRLTVVNSQAWTEPQSWPTRWTGRSGLTASATARKSSVNFSSVNPPRSGCGADDLPWPRTSYSTTWKCPARRAATSDHTSLESG